MEWVAIFFSRGSSQPRDRTHVSCLEGRFFTTEPPGQSLLRGRLILLVKDLNRHFSKKDTWMANKTIKGYFFLNSCFENPLLCQATGGQLFEERTVSDLLNGIPYKCLKYSLLSKSYFPLYSPFII